MNESLIQVEKNCFQSRIFSGKLDMLSSIRNLYCFPKAKDLNLLVKMLPVEVHHIAGLMFAKTTNQRALIILFWFFRITQHFRLNHWTVLKLAIFWIRGSLDGWKFKSIRFFCRRQQISFCDFESASAHLVQWKRRVRLNPFWSDWVVDAPSLLVHLSR